MVLGIVLATVVSFVVSAALYATPPAGRLLARYGRPRPGLSVPVQMATVVLRSLLAAGLVAGLMVAAGWHGAAAGAVLGLGLSVLPALLLLGGVVHESTPVPLAALHLADWVLKLVVIGALVGLLA